MHKRSPAWPSPCSIFIFWRVTHSTQMPCCSSPPPPLQLAPLADGIGLPFDRLTSRPAQPLPRAPVRQGSPDAGRRSRQLPCDIARKPRPVFRLTAPLRHLTDRGSRVSSSSHPGSRQADD